MTKWCWIPEYESLYCVSDAGQVWSVPRKTTKGGLLKQVLHPDGRLYVTLTRDGKQKRYQVHRLVLLGFEGFPKEGQECRHLDGNPANNFRSNLTWGTHSENIRDKQQHGTNTNLNKTHCPKGHDYDEVNTLVFDNRRFCKKCASINAARWYKARKEAGNPTWTPSAELSPEKLERRRALARERMRRYSKRKREN